MSNQLIEDIISTIEEAYLPNTVSNKMVAEVLKYTYLRASEAVSSGTFKNEINRLSKVDSLIFGSVKELSTSQDQLRERLDSHDLRFIATDETIANLQAKIENLILASGDAILEDLLNEIDKRDTAINKNAADIAETRQSLTLSNRELSSRVLNNSNNISVHELKMDEISTKIVEHTSEISNNTDQIEILKGLFRGVNNIGTLTFSNKNTIDVSSMSPGLYFLEAVTESGGTGTVGVGIYGFAGILLVSSVYLKLDRYNGAFAAGFVSVSNGNLRPNREFNLLKYSGGWNSLASDDVAILESRVNTIEDNYVATDVNQLDNLK